MPTRIDERFRGDKAPVNGSAIAFPAECEGSGSCLFIGDAQHRRGDAIAVAPARQARLRVDAVKPSYHGGRYNFDPAPLQVVESPRFIASTGGSRFSHPTRK